MKVQVYINGWTVYEEEVSSYTVDRVLDYLDHSFHIGLLKKCGVDAYLVIVEVPSMMNSIAFTPKAESFDEIFFKEIEE